MFLLKIDPTSIPHRLGILDFGLPIGARLKPIALREKFNYGQWIKTIVIGYQF
jgi:hypothetical protein